MPRASVADRAQKANRQGIGNGNIINHVFQRPMPRRWQSRQTGKPPAAGNSIGSHAAAGGLPGAPFVGRFYLGPLWTCLSKAGTVPAGTPSRKRKEFILINRYLIYEICNSLGNMGRFYAGTGHPCLFCTAKRRPFPGRPSCPSPERSSEFFPVLRSRGGCRRLAAAEGARQLVAERPRAGSCRPMLAGCGGDGA